MATKSNLLRMTDEFENNLMPKLAQEYKETGNKKTPFGLEKIRNLGRDNGFATQAWDAL
jgi:hypothetical protein